MQFRTWTRIAVLALTAIPLMPSSGAIKPPAERKPAPAFQLKDATGKMVKLADHKGKVVLLNFWATWCAPCRKEMPWFVDFTNLFGKQGFVVLGVSTDEDFEEARAYAKDVNLNYPILHATKAMMQSYGGAEPLPTTFLIDREGRIADSHKGLVPRGEYETSITRLLGK